MPNPQESEGEKMMKVANAGTPASLNSLRRGGCSTLSCFSHVRFFATPWSVAHQAPVSMEFSRQEQWSGLACPSAGYPNPGIEPWSPALQTDSLLSEPPGRIYRQNAVEISQTALTLKPVTFKISSSCM